MAIRKLFVNDMEKSSFCSEFGFMDKCPILTKPAFPMRNRVIRERLAEIKSLLRLKAEEVAGLA